MIARTALNKEAVIEPMIENIRAAEREFVGGVVEEPNFEVDLSAGGGKEGHAIVGTVDSALVWDFLEKILGEPVKYKRY